MCFWIFLLILHINKIQDMKYLLKTTMVMFLLLATSLTSRAQNQRLMQLQEASERLYGQFREHVNSKNYNDAIVPLKELINFFDTTTVHLDPTVEIPKEALDNQKAIYQYDLACCYAILGKKKMALETLAASVDNGYANYNNMLWDKDFTSIKKDKKFQALLDIVKGRQPLEKLKKSNGYKAEAEDVIPKFEYQPKEHPNLQLVREYFQLDTIPGKDNELEHIKNLLHFVHDKIRHDGSSKTICEYNAIDLYNYAKATGKGVNCRMLAIALCDVYLAMGYKARVVTCLAADPNDPDCHVINTVWSSTLHKWLYIDPTMDAWVMDENGLMLSIAEVRERLIDGRELVLCPTANWNHETMQTKEYYLETYMAKNLYYQVCKKRSFFNQESIYRSTNNEDIRLIPAGFENNNYQSAATTTDPERFWATPE